MIEWLMLQNTSAVVAPDAEARMIEVVDGVAVRYRVQAEGAGGAVKWLKLHSSGAVAAAARCSPWVKVVPATATTAFFELNRKAMFV